MKTFTYHPDDAIIIDAGDYQYNDTLAPFVHDAVVCGLPLIPEKPTNIRLYVASQDAASQVSYAQTKGDLAQVGFSRTGHKPEDFFCYIDAIKELLDAQRARRNPKEKDNG